MLPSTPLGDAALDSARSAVYHTQLISGKNRYPRLRSVNGFFPKLTLRYDTLEIRIKKPGLDYVLGYQKMKFIRQNDKPLKDPELIRDSLDRYFNASGKSAAYLRLCDWKGSVKYFGLWREEGFIDRVKEYDEDGEVIKTWIRKDNVWEEAE